MDAERQKRVAKNEAVFRLINEQMQEGHAQFALHGPQEYVCECSDIQCTDRVYLTQDEYQRVRSNARRFFVVPGHELPDIENVVETYANYAVVEKFGVAGEIAEDHEPPA